MLLLLSTVKSKSCSLYRRASIPASLESISLLGFSQYGCNRTFRPCGRGIDRDDNKQWWQKSNLRLLYLLLIPTCIGIEITSGFDSTLMNGIQSLRYWQVYFHHPTGSILGVLTASYNLGALTAVPFASFLSDYFGRRGSIAVGSLVMLVGAVIQCFAINITMWVFARLFLGHGIVYAVIGGAALVGELAHPKERAILASLFGGMYAVGGLIAAAIVLKTLQIHSDWSWRLPSILQACPSMVQLSLIFFMPESPRWLISKGRSAEALATLIKYHAEGDENAQLPRIEYVQITTAIEVENSSRAPGWGELFQTSGMRRRTFIATFLAIFSQWSGNSLINLYFVKILIAIGFTDSVMQNQINVGLQAWNFLSVIILATTIPRFPRRRIFITGTCFVLATYTMWLIGQAQNSITGSKAAGIAALVGIFLFQTAYLMTWNIMMYMYLVEIFPFYVRTKGIAWYQLWQRSSGFFSSFVNPIGLDAIGWKYLLVYTAVICFELVFVWFFFPETGNRTLEELTFLFESQEEKDKITEKSEAVLSIIEGSPVTELVTVKASEKV